jgi:hypothetical protein
MKPMIDHNPYPQPNSNTVCSWEGYLYFVYEREAMRIARENDYKGALSEDPTLCEYRFTNIRRRDDRMTQWFIEHLIQPFVNRQDLWFTLLIARLVNWPPTLQRLLANNVIPCEPKDFNPTLFSYTVESLKGDGKVFGNAYMVYPTMKDPGSLKSYRIAKHIIGDAVLKASQINYALWDAEMREPCIERFVAELSTVFGVSTFTAGQVAADLTYDPGHLGNAVDLYCYAPLGPGSQAGLNLLHKRKLTLSWNQADFNAALMEANEKIAEELDITDLTLHDVQNTMCEYSKYAKSTLKIARPRRLYTPELAY